jgi:hypothetical protein
LLAVVAERLLPGKWFIVIGGVGGALVAALRPEPILAAKRTGLPTSGKHSKKTQEEG